VWAREAVKGIPGAVMEERMAARAATRAAEMLEGTREAATTKGLVEERGRAELETVEAVVAERMAARAVIRAVEMLEGTREAATTKGLVEERGRAELETVEAVVMEEKGENGRR
jgi:hypothetical protein